MAKVTVTFEDLPNGKVKVVSDPSVETFFKIDISGHALTSAQGYALSAINHIHKASKDKDTSLNIKMPKVVLS
jgi:hypothetical protein